ncbi:hypothetical protein VCHA53O466_320013 [Vibrio chagasii]|nr:hypothetical protein VCHA53O466_320013 [Vibrio chagasii]
MNKLGLSQIAISGITCTTYDAICNLSNGSNHLFTTNADSIIVDLSELEADDETEVSGEIHKLLKADSTFDYKSFIEADLSHIELYRK